MPKEDTPLTDICKHTHQDFVLRFDADPQHNPIKSLQALHDALPRNFIVDPRIVPLINYATPIFCTLRGFRITTPFNTLIHEKYHQPKQWMYDWNENDTTGFLYYPTFYPMMDKRTIQLSVGGDGKQQVVLTRFLDLTNDQTAVATSSTQYLFDQEPDYPELRTTLPRTGETVKPSDSTTTTTSHTATTTSSTDTNTVLTGSLISTTKTRDLTLSPKQQSTITTIRPTTPTLSKTSSHIGSTKPVMTSK
jgi:hypothetical protein